MKRLIKLLNEWLKYKEKFGPDKLTRVAGIDDSGELLFKLDNGCYWSVEYVISKRCKFIKWLVENDKIERDRVDDSYENKFFGYTNYQILLMLLSISDSPIDDLITYLK